MLRPDFTVADLGELSTLHVSGIEEGANAWVESEGDYWTLEKSSGAAPGVNVVAPLGGSPIAGAATARWVRQAGGGGGGGAGNTQDLSVNKANSIGRILHTQTGSNAAGAYNGGGLGNKSILGVSGFDGAPLSPLTLQMVWQSILGDPAVLSTHPFFNLLMDVGGTGTLALISISDTLPPASDNNLVVTNLGGGAFRYNFDATINTFQVVTLAAIPAAVPVVNNGPAFFQRAYNAAGILAAYPNTVLRGGLLLDGGLPNNTVVPAVLVALGDSANLAMLTRQIVSLVINGNLV